MLIQNRAQERPQEIVEIEKLRVQRALVALANNTDRQDWAKLRTLLASEVEIDFAAAGTPEILSAEDLVSRCQQEGAAANGTQHGVASWEVEIQGATARVISFGHSFHRPALAAGHDLWLLFCRFEHELRKVEGSWKLTRIRMAPVHRPAEQAAPRRRKRLRHDI